MGGWAGETPTSQEARDPLGAHSARETRPGLAHGRRRYQYGEEGVKEKLPDGGILQPSEGAVGQRLAGMWDFSNYINFFHTVCHRAAAEMARGESPWAEGEGAGIAGPSMTWWRTPVVDPSRRSGPKVPDEERKGIRVGTAGHGPAILVVDLIANVPQYSPGQSGQGRCQAA